MPAYLLILVAILSRVAPHAGWMNFTALTGALLYFGARRSWREMLAPLAALAATDYLLTVYQYHYAFQVSGYLLTWTWCAAVMALGHLLLNGKTSLARVGAGVVLGPTSFWLMSNYAAWLMLSQPTSSASATYPHTLTGLGACYVAAIPFYRNDLVSTAIVAGLAFGVPVLVRRMNAEKALAEPAK